MKALIIGASGALGGAIADALEQRCNEVVRLSRSSDPGLDLADDSSIAHAAKGLATRAPFDLIMLATGVLHDDAVKPEKSLREIDGGALDHYFRINATGPAVVMRHFLPLLSRAGSAAGASPTFAALSARVGSIGDNRLGGWVGYRASKAALNQIVRTLAIELARTNPAATLMALHPGTVDARLSQPFLGNVGAPQLLSPADSAAHLIEVMAGLGPADSGGHFDWRGTRVVP